MCANPKTTLYFSICDKFAIDRNIWMFNNDYILESNILVVPYEEMYFFFVTSIMCILSTVQITNYFYSDIIKLL